MKFTVHRDPFYEALQTTQSVVEKKSTVPILSNALLSVQKGELSISATDLEVGAKILLPVEGAQDGKLTLSAKNLLEIVKELPKAKIEIARKDNDWVEITSGKSKFKVTSLSANEYPSLPAFEDKNYLTANTEALREMIDRTSFAVSTDATRYLMNGVYFEGLQENVMRMTATDGHRLAFMDREVFTKSPDMKRGIIIPKKGLTELRKFLDGKSGTIGLAFERGYVFAKLETGYLFIRLIEGEYPDYRQVIPKAADKVVKMGFEDFHSALKRVSLLAHEKSRGVKFSVQGKTMTLFTSNPELGEAREEIDVEYKGEPIHIAFNAKYLLDCLASGMGKELELSLKDHLSPGILRAAGQANYHYVVMPMRI